MNINVDSVFKTQGGSYLVYKYTGVIAIDAEVMAIFTMSSDKKTTAFGRACKSFIALFLWDQPNSSAKVTQIKFEVSDLISPS